MYSSKKVCTVLIHKLCSSEVCCLVAQRCKKVSRNSNGRLSYEMIGETQPEMELLDVVAFLYPPFC